MDVVLPEAVCHEQHFLAGRKVVLTHSDHFTVPQHLRCLPAQQLCIAILLEEGEPYLLHTTVQA